MYVCIHACMYVYMHVCIYMQIANLRVRGISFSTQNCAQAGSCPDRVDLGASINTTRFRV